MPGKNVKTKSVEKTHYTLRKNTKNDFLISRCGDKRANCKLKHVLFTDNDIKNYKQFIYRLPDSVIDRAMKTQILRKFNRIVDHYSYVDSSQLSKLKYMRKMYFEKMIFLHFVIQKLAMSRVDMEMLRFVTAPGVQIVDNTHTTQSLQHYAIISNTNARICAECILHNLREYYAQRYSFSQKAISAIRYILDAIALSLLNKAQLRVWQRKRICSIDLSIYTETTDLRHNGRYRISDSSSQPINLLNCHRVKDGKTSKNQINQGRIMKFKVIEETIPYEKREIENLIYMYNLYSLDDPDRCVQIINHFAKPLDISNAI